jgi:DNA repair protein RadC
MGETTMSNRGGRAPVPTLRDPTPSPEDIRVTRDLVAAGKLLDIEVLDHLVIGRNRYVSLRQKKLGFD